VRSLERGDPTPEQAAAARARLQQLCRDIISAEAASSTSLGGGGRHQQQQQQQAAVGGVKGSSSGGDDPMRDILYGTSWEHAVRAPLVELALDLLRGMPGPDLRAEVRAAFPALARLVCSNHVLLRGALARLMGAPEVLEMVAAAAAAGVPVPPAALAAAPAAPARVPPGAQEAAPQAAVAAIEAEAALLL
jgi:hypothetical protein